MYSLAASARRRYCPFPPNWRLVVAKARDDLYMQAHPTAVDALLVVEVGSTTLRFDRNVKVPMYARHDVPEVWVLDVDGQLIHRHRSPQGGQYASTTTVQLAARISLDALAGEIDLRSLATRLTESQGA
jgi:hypothetical protein